MMPRVIACLDVLDGLVHKGTGFVDLKEMGCPVALAKHYADVGADEIVFLDIGASPSERRSAFACVERTAATLDIPLTMGGGLRSLEDVRCAFAAGADKVALNTAALQRPALISEVAACWGSQCVVVSIDVGADNRVYARGGREATP